MADHGHGITANVLCKAVQNEFKLSDMEDIEISTFEVNSGSNLGDNFGSKLKLVNFTFRMRDKKELQNHSYVIKCLPLNKNTRKMVGEIDFFPTEINFYEFVLKDIQRLRRVFDMTPLPFPKCFYASKEEGIIILENLLKYEFSRPSKIYQLKGLPLEYTRKIFVELGHFHAVAYHYMQTYPGRVKEFYQNNANYTEGYFGILRRSKVFEDLHLDNVSLAAKALFNNFVNKRLGQKMEVFSKQISVAKKETEKPKGNFVVILHGDAWMNNFMFRKSYPNYEREVAIIDMQLSRIGSPASDLVYFLTSSTSWDSRTRHLDTWFRSYHRALTGDLAAYGHSKELFTYDELLEEVNHLWSFALEAGLFHAQRLQLNSKENEEYYHKMRTETDLSIQQQLYGKWRMDRISHPEYVRRVLNLATEAEERGVF